MTRSLIALILAASAAIPASAAEEKVTYSKDVAAILFKNCASCHRAGEVAPFSLLTYKDAAKRADQLVESTAKRIMPPWEGRARPRRVPRCSSPRRKRSRGARRLGPKAGAPEGDPGDLPTPPTFPNGWPLGKPDLVVKMNKPFELPAEGRDQIRIIPLPLNLTQDKVIRAVDFRPGNRKIVHHALVVVDNLGIMRDRTDMAKKAGDNRLGGALGLLQARPGATPFALIGSWVPGTTPQFFPDGYGVPMAKDSKVVLQMHYHPVGKAETDQSEVAFYFDKKPAKSIHSFLMAGLPLAIPAGEKRYRVSTTVTLPVDITVHGIGPHMHQVGREMKVMATLPDGQTQPLIWIKDWDWNWQGRYTYQEPVKLPKGNPNRSRSVLRQLDRESA